MSNSLAVAAVTTVIRNRLSVLATPLTGETTTDLSDTQVTTLPPTKPASKRTTARSTSFSIRTSPAPPAETSTPEAKQAESPPSPSSYFICSRFMVATAASFLPSDSSVAP